jgi:predicted dehydrogenase
MIRVAIFGSGRVAKVRLRELAGHARARAAVILTSDLARARELAPDLPATTDRDAVLSDSNIDAVMVCSSNRDHESQARAALEAGKAVSVDYPLALSASGAASLALLARQRSLVLHGEHIDLLSPWYLALQAALPRLGALRELRWVDVSTRRPGGERDWIFDRRSGFSLFVHAASISRLLRIAGEMDLLQASEERQPSDSDAFEARLTQARWDAAGVAVSLRDGVGQAREETATLTATGEHGVAVATRASVALNGDPVAIPVTRGLFAQDIDSFLDQIQGKGGAYAALDHSLSVLDHAERVRRAVS